MATVDFVFTQTTITATANDPLNKGVAITANNITDNLIDLAAGANVIRVTVTAEDDSTERYTVTIHRTPAATDTTLSTLSLSDITLSPTFAPATQTYTATVAHDFTTTVAIATANDDLASNVVVTSDQDSNTADGINIVVGDNIITVTVTAQSDDARSYTITINRPAVSTDTTLSQLSFNGVTLSPAFVATTTTYSATVAYTTTTTTITATANADLAQGVAILSNKDADIGADNAVQLAVGDNAIFITVTAQNGATGIYTITITRTPASTDTTLAALSFSDVNLSPAFASLSRSYTATVDYVLTQTTITATATDSLNKGVAITAADINNNLINLAVGDNIITVTVTAEDNSTDVYTITITRAAVSTDTTLSELSFSDITLSPEFVATTRTYSATVAYTVTTTTITATKNADLAKGVTITSDQDDNTADGINLNVGANIITVTVTAQDDSSGVYTITITLDAVSTDTTLSELSFSGIDLSPAFVSTTRTYSATVAYTFMTTTVTATANTDLAKGVTVTSAEDDNTDDGINLTIGDNIITVTVTAQSDLAQSYTITIHRTPASDDTTLSELSFSGVNLSPAFVSTTRTYTATVAYTVTETTITAIANADLAKNVAVRADNIADNLIQLAPGDNVITIDVVAEDESDASYTITISRALPALRITADADSVREGRDAAVAFTVTADAEVTVNTPVHITLSGAQNFVTATTTTKTLLAGDSSVRVEFSIVGDRQAEPDAEARAQIEPSDDYTIVAGGDVATVTVEDDDLRDEPAITVTTLSITADAKTVTEGADANLSFTVRSSLPAPFGGIEVTVVLAGADAFVADDDDDTPGITDETVTIADGQTSVAVQFPITDDDVAEVDAMVLALLRHRRFRRCQFIGEGNHLRRRSPRCNAVRCCRFSVVGDDDTDLLAQNFDAGVTDYVLAIELERDDDGEITTRINVDAEVQIKETMIMPPTVDIELNDADVAAGTIRATGEATLVAGENVITVEVTAADDETTLIYTLTINRGTLTESALPSLSSVTRAISGQIIGEIGGRINAVASHVNAPSANQINLASLRDETAMANFINNQKDNINLKQLLTNNDFVLSLGDASPTENAGGLSSLSLWASGGIGGVDGDANTTDWHGDFNNATLGMDAKVRDDLLIGAALSKTVSEMDYQDSAMPNRDGKYKLRLTGVHPYLAKIVGDASVWASIGTSSGELKFTDDDDKLDAKLAAYSIGGEQRIAYRKLRVKGELTHSRLRLSGAQNFAADASAATLLMVAGNNGKNIELGVHYHDDDNRTAFGYEARANLRRTVNRLTVSADLQAGSNENNRQWRAQGTLNLAPKKDQQGTNLTVTPTITATNKPQLNAKIAYGITGTFGLVTPFYETFINTTNQQKLGINWMPMRGVKLKLTNKKTNTSENIKLEVVF